MQKLEENLDAIYFLVGRTCLPASFLSQSQVLLQFMKY